jgi:hypothetical protein
MESIDSKMLNKFEKYSTPPFGNTTVSWNIYIRKEYKEYSTRF